MGWTPDSGAGTSASIDADPSGRADEHARLNTLANIRANTDVNTHAGTGTHGLANTGANTSEPDIAYAVSGDGALSATASRLGVPPGACDCHMHVYDERYGAPADSGFKPPAADAALYRHLVQAPLGLERVVVVQANRYGSDNRGMLEAMASFGDGARGVVVVPPGVDEHELQRLGELGVRGVRFHMLPGGHLQWPQLDDMVARVRPFGWHVQVQLNGWELPQHVQRLRALPVDCVIDHIGKYLDPAPPTVDDPAFKALQHLLDGGRAWVKLSAPYESSRCTAPGYDDVAPLARALVRSHPERCVWASNWPHPGRDNPPSNAGLLDALLSWADDDTTRRRILADNPATLYGFPQPGATIA